MVDIVPVDYDPFKGGGPAIAPVDYDPFAGQTMGAAAALPSAVVDDPSRSASTGTQAISSLPTDELTRVKYLATQRFPDLTPEDAMSKYFYKDNRLAYRGPDGKGYFEDPKLGLPTSLPALQNDAKAAASGVGPALPAIGSTLGGIASMAEGPPGWMTGVGQAGAGGALGDIIRQGAAKLFTGEAKDWLPRILQTGEATGEGMISQLFGNGIAKGLGFLGQTPTYNIPATTERQTNAAKFGISLTPAEETGNRTLINRQRLLQNTPGADETFANFYSNRNGQVSSAVDDLLKSLDPNYQAAGQSMGLPQIVGAGYASPRAGMSAGVEGAQAAVNKVRQDMQVQAAPYYTKALAPGQIVPQRAIQDALDPAEQTILQGIIGDTRADKVLGPKLQGWQDNSMYVLDQAKKNTDALISAAKDAKDQNRVSILTGMKNKLLGVMDNVSPDYRTARGIYTDGMPGRNAIENGIVGDIAPLQNNDVLSAGKALFGANSSPEDVRIAKEAFKKANQMDQWDQLASGYLRQVFNAIPDTATGTIPNIAGTYRKAVFGSPARRDMMTAAFDHNPRFLGDFKALMDTLDATSAASRSDSITAFAQAGQKQLQREGGGVIPALLDTVEFWNTPSNVASYMRDVNTAKYANRQAELFTTPEGRDTLRELRRLGPKSSGAVLTLSNFLTAGGAGGLKNAYVQNPDGPIGGASGGQPNP